MYCCLQAGKKTGIVFLERGVDECGVLVLSCSGGGGARRNNESPGREERWKAVVVMMEDNSNVSRLLGPRRAWMEDGQWAFGYGGRQS